MKVLAHKIWLNRALKFNKVINKTGQLVSVRPYSMGTRPASLPVCNPPPTHPKFWCLLGDILSLFQVRFGTSSLPQPPATMVWRWWLPTQKLSSAWFSIRANCHFGCRPLGAHQSKMPIDCFYCWIVFENQIFLRLCSKNWFPAFFTFFSSCQFSL